MSHFHVAGSHRKSVRCAAGTLSLLAHAAVLAILMSQTEHRDWPSSIGRKVGSALIVRLKTHTASVESSSVAQAMRPTPASALAHPSSDTTRPAEKAPKVSPAPPNSQIDSTDSPSAPMDQPAVAVPMTPPASSPPGASFANLFAPIISRPMGRGRWTAPPSQVQPPVEPDLQRQHATQARRDQLMQTIQWLQKQLDLTPLAGGCLIQVTLQQSSGEVRCADPEDQDRIRSATSSLLLTGLQPNVPSEVCLQLQQHTINWIDCQQVSPKN